jgi:hypothetical protein
MGEICFYSKGYTNTHLVLFKVLKIKDFIKNENLIKIFGSLFDLKASFFYFKGAFFNCKGVKKL